MLRIEIPTIERYDESKNEFIVSKGAILQLEHSLVSLSKWESKWHKPFLSKEEKTKEESIDYIKCMTLTQNVSPEVYKNLTNDIIEQVSKYIQDPMTATWFSEDKNSKPNREVITSELIYYWMIALNIPIEWEKRHLNRLLTLVRVCNIKNQPPKKMSKGDIISRNKALNAARRKANNSKG